MKRQSFYSRCYAWLVASCLLPGTLLAQQHSEQNHTHYITPTDSLVRQKLTQWQGIKFGLLMHWGTYSQWGIVESWSLCPEDEGWCVRRGPYAANWYDYKRAYENLQTTFNPTEFNPERWATAAKEAGMKYVVFTTKHHDGFCMFDTKQTDYKITDPKSPFSSNPRSNVAKEVFNAFRAQNFMVGAYFSKPDWHTPYYWDPYFPPKDRNVSYSPQKYPERWQKFKDFTYNQIQELMTDYGKIDILWLDGGWVRPRTTIDSTISWQRTIPYDQDIDMARIARMGRSHQPGLLVVDRTVTGEFENYVTPEQSIPDSYMPIPWESCMTMGDSWSYIPKENFKPTRKLIHTLVDIVAKNGNLLLNIAPSPNGDWHPEAYQRLQEIGAWLRINGESIYDTKPVAPYRQKQWAYTGNGSTVYQTYLPVEQETPTATLTLSSIVKTSKPTIKLLGYAKPLKYSKSSDGFVVVLPDAARKWLQSQPAWVFKVSER
ncbi:MULTISPECIES: alpha-L-fucosidase [unclassified Spirosoma]|uniref:alpha-L-fucosidase n=1 Tax=unclassified Spirosoma TaxID=2621999 RepID=UPI0009612135|nr:MULTISPECIES: alpha-L-fucosidase [unclassified Spirosoma]MBN8823325.1 alpha-L-fucosidase [Spirosoma sp.]OJW72533.1 MAG: alpha-L-fucosidase [Spirosoma sp. 48-14]